MKSNKEETSKGLLSTVAFFNALSKYIPSLVLQNWIEIHVKDELQQVLQKKMLMNSNVNDNSPPPLKKQQLPHLQEMETVVLFADISGFTNISEACAKHGIRGNEELAFCINRYMEGMVKNLAKYGGDIIKFVGDAMIVMWPRKDINDEDEKITIIRKSIQCACDIQNEMNNKKIMANVTNLSVKIGIGFGKCALLYVGGVFDRSEFFTVGPALTSALGSEEQATCGGQILVSDTAFKYVKNQYYEGHEIIAADGKKFYRVTDVVQGVRGRADAVLLKSQVKVDKMANIQKSLKSCVPAAIMPYLEIGYEQFGSETRAITVMFASLGVDLSSATSEEGMNKIQKIVTTVQQQVYRMEGSVNKLVMDDKGSTLIVIWGLCPMAHTDDPQRAILTAQNMRRELLKIENTWCNVGIATGDVFTGVVGTSGSRKEFSVLGDTVNLSARIMFWPLKFGQHGKIHVCLRTKNEAMNQISFKYGQHCEFKGKSISIPIFEPLDPLDEYSVKDSKAYANKMIPPLALLKTHYNPLIVQKEVNHKMNNDKFIGKTTFIAEIYDKIKDYFFSRNQKHIGQENQPLNIVLTGESGSGKTHLMRYLVEKMQKDQDFNSAQVAALAKQQSMVYGKQSQMNHSQSMMNFKMSSSKFPIYASNINAQSRMIFLGAWRPILRNMLESMRRQGEQNKNKILRSLIVNHLDKVDLILQIFGVTTGIACDADSDLIAKQNILGSLKEEDQCQNLTDKHPIGFVQRDKFENQVTDSLLDLIIQFIRNFLGDEQESDSDSMVESSIESQPKKRVSLKSKNLVGARHNQCILIFDHASIMDQESCSLMMRVYQQCSNVCLVLVVDQDYKGNPIFPKLEPHKQNYSGGQNIPYSTQDVPIYEIFVDNAAIFDMPSLNRKEFKRMLLEMAPLYKKSYQEEIRLMTEIKDPEKTIKTKEKSDEWLKLLTGIYNLDRIYIDVDTEIIDIIIQKCGGNTIISLQFFFNLMSNGYIEIEKDGVVRSKKTFDMCVQLQNFTKIPVPSNAIKKRLKDMDTYLKEGRANSNVRKQELVVKGLMVMKAAAIIGEEFSTAALKKILPLRQESHSSLLIILKELEVGELIEILDETDPKNIFCRFNQCWLRETLYQIMLFRDQKKVLHQQLAIYIQSLPSSLMDQNQIELEIIKLREHIIIGEDVKSEKELPFKQQYGLIVKKMQNQLIKNNSKIILHKDFVLKQGKKASKKISKRLLILTSKDLQWFHSTNEYEENKQPLGIIKVEHIFQCVDTMMQSTTFDFEISVTQYIKKGVLENTVRTIKFGCVTEGDRHNWISRIEFLKAKLVYENYVNKFVNVQFPLKKEEDADEDDQEHQKDMLYEKLHQFGKNFKQNARINHQTATTSLNRQSTLQQNQLGSIMTSASNMRNTLNQANRRQSLKSQQSFPRPSQFDDNNNPQYQQQNVQSAKDLAVKINRLFNASIICVLNQATANANKNQGIGKNKKIGKVPEYYFPEWMFDTNAVSDNNSVERRQSANIFENESQRILVRGKSQDNLPQQSQKQIRSDGRSPTPDNIQEIDEVSEGSSSENNVVPIQKNVTAQQKQTEKIIRKNFKPRGSQNIQSDQAQRILQQITTNMDPGHSSQEKNSGNSVSVQLKMLEESKMGPGFNNQPARNERGFTFSKNKGEEQSPPKALQQERQNHHIRGPSYGCDSNTMSLTNINRGNSRENKFQPNNVQMIQPNQLDISSIHNGTDYGQTQQFNHPPGNVQQISPLIQQEINKQINIGMSQFFKNLEIKKIQKNKERQQFNSIPEIQEGMHRNNNSLSMQQLFDISQSQINRQQNFTANNLNTLNRSHHASNQNDLSNIKKNDRFIEDRDCNSSYSSNAGGVGGKNHRMNFDNRPQSKQSSVYGDGDENDDDDEPMDPNIEQEEVNVYLNKKR